MSDISNPAQSEVSEGSLPVKKPVEVLVVDPVDLKNDQPQRKRSRLGKLGTGFLLALAPTIFCATLAWKLYGDAAKLYGDAAIKAIASSFPQLGRSASQVAPVAQNAPDISAPAATAGQSPDQQQLNAMSLDLDEVRHSVDRLATSIAASQEKMTQGIDQIAASIAASQEKMTQSIDQIAATQERMARTVDQLTAGQEQMTREITKLQAIEQYVRNSEPLQPQASARSLPRGSRGGGNSPPSR